MVNALLLIAVFDVHFITQVKRLSNNSSKTLSVLLIRLLHTFS